MPLALLAWLGTYLHTDGERRSKATRDAIVTERLQVANHQLLSDFKLAVRQLDQVVEAGAATTSAEVCPPVAHVWIQASYCQRPGGEPLLTGDEEKRSALREPMDAFQRGAGSTRERGGQRDQDFEPLAIDLGSGWKAFRLGPVLAPVTDVRLPGQDDSGLLIREGREPLPEMIHWHLLPDGRMLGALLDSARFLGVLFENMPPSGLKALPGRMSLVSGDNSTLHGAAADQGVEHLDVKALALDQGLAILDIVGDFLLLLEHGLDGFDVQFQTFFCCGVRHSVAPQ